MDYKILFPAKDILDAASDGTLKNQGSSPFKDICSCILSQTKGDKNPLDLTQRFVRDGLRLQTLSYFKDEYGRDPNISMVLLHNSRHTGTGLVYSISFSSQFEKDGGNPIKADILITSENRDIDFKMEFLCQFIEGQPLYTSWGTRGRDFVHKALVKMMDPNGTGFRLFLPPQADEINGLDTDEEKLQRLNAI